MAVVPWRSRPGRPRQGQLTPPSPSRWAPRIPQAPHKRITGSGQGGTPSLRQPPTKGALAHGADGICLKAEVSLQPPAPADLTPPRPGSDPWQRPASDVRAPPPPPHTLRQPPRAPASSVPPLPLLSPPTPHSTAHDSTPHLPGPALRPPPPPHAPTCGLSPPSLSTPSTPTAAPGPLGSSRGGGERRWPPSPRRRRQRRRVPRAGDVRERQR